MGPALAPNSATDGLIWAHYWSHMCCRWSCMGLALAQKYSTDGIVWVQHWSQNILPITLYGPRAGLKLRYRWSYMGPLLVPHVLLMVLHGPSTGQNQWHCMG